MHYPKLYIAGPMSNVPDYNYPEFFKAEKKLVEAGYEVVNPASMHKLDEPLPAYDVMLAEALKASLDCNAMALLPDWQNSYGAWLEASVFRALNRRISTVHEWLWLAVRDGRYTMELKEES